VFIGRAVSVSEIADADVMYPGPKLRYRFEVIEAFHGVEGPTADVVTGRGGGDCGFEFRLGESYFLYAGTTKNGEYSAWICGPTKRLDHAKADVAYARQAAREEARTGLYGRVVQVDRDDVEDFPSSEGLAGLLVRIEGPGGQRYSARTDDRGGFRIQGKLEGSYTVYTELPGDFPPVEAQQVEVPAGRCAGVEISVPAAPED
jgi:hypothetical protein